MKKLIIFGATGDLVKSKIIPALDRLNIECISYGRRDIKTTNYIRGELDEIANKLNNLEISHAYVALPPIHYELVLRELAQLPSIQKIALEKPFGTSSEVAENLIKLIKELNIEEKVYLVDHYLGKFSKTFSKFDRNQISSIEIIATETSDVDHRGAFYDTVGTIKDYVQNHVMAIISSLINAEIRLDILAKLNLVNGSLQIAQYDGFTNASGVRPDSVTETAVSLKLNYDNKFDIEIYAGKALSKSEVIATVRYINGECMDINVNAGGNPYEVILLDFLNNTDQFNLSFTEALLCWGIAERILTEKVGKTPVIYKRGSDIMQIWKP